VSRRKQEELFQGAGVVITLALSIILTYWR